MKLIIEIPKEVVVAIENGFDYRYDIHTAIAQGTPYDEKTQGNWIMNKTSSRGRNYTCPNCGAEMRGDENE